MRKEGLLVGGSSGSSLSGAVKWLKESERANKLQLKRVSMLLCCCLMGE